MARASYTFRLDPFAADYDAAIQLSEAEDDGYWYFIQSSRSSPPARIEYLFDVFVRSQRDEATEGLVDDPLATFLEFQELLEAKDARVWPIWQLLLFNIAGLFEQTASTHRFQFDGYKTNSTRSSLVVA